jgi:endonuclease/exonuclease/phosphatase family metal-dependent hydrolase
VTLRLATFNVENLFARAKALDTEDRDVGQPALSAFEAFNRIAANPVYSDQDKADMIKALTTLRVLIETDQGLRLNPNQFDDAWALLRENRGDFLAAPANAPPRVVASGRGDWLGWVELTVEPVDETSTRMTAKVIQDLAPDMLCVVEAENRPALARFNEELLGARFAHCMLVDGNDPRGIDVGLFCTDKVKVRWVRSNVDVPDPKRKGKRLFSRDCPVYQLRLPGGEDLFLLLNHLKSQSFSSGDPDPLRTRQALEVRAIYDGLRAEGADFVAVLGDLNKGPDGDRHPTLEALFGPDSPLVDAYEHPNFAHLWGDKDDDHERPGSFQSCSLKNRLDYILMSPALADRVVDGGVFRKGLWGTPSNKTRPRFWTVYDEITAGRHGASDHGAVWVDLDL